MRVRGLILSVFALALTGVEAFGEHGYTVSEDGERSSHQVIPVESYVDKYSAFTSDYDEEQSS